MNAALIGFLTILCVQPAAGNPAARDAGNRDEAVINWLRRQAAVFSDAQSNGFEDLKPLQRILKDVHVVGVGEATHGTSEFVQIRHRLLKFLAQEMGFTVLAVEFSSSDAVLINDYVMHGQTSREQVLACLKKSWISDTEEMRAVVDWMHEYNARTPEARRLKFIGIDPQGNTRAIERVKTYLAKVAPERVGRAEELFRILREEDSHALGFAPTEVPKQQLAELYKLISYLVLHRADLIRRNSAEQWDRALGDLKLLAQFAEFNSPSATDDVGTRDGYMAENFLDAFEREKPGTRFVVWAHNAHVCKRDVGRFPALGSYFRKHFSNNYYSFGFAFDSGSFRAQLPRLQPPKLGVFNLGPAPAGTVDWYMARTGLASYLVDLRSPPDDAAVTAWLKTPHNLHWVGAFFSENSPGSSSARSFVLGRDFDGLIFVAKGTPTRPNS